MTDVVIRAGTLVTPSGPQLADLAIADGVIGEISAGATAGREEIDATGLLVMPGVIDVHLLVSRLGATDHSSRGHDLQRRPDFLRTVAG